MKPNYFSLLLLLLALPLQVLADAGEVRFVQGDVRIQQASGKIEAAKRGSKVAEGDTIITSPAGYAQLTMSDDAIIAVRPDTQIKIETYRFGGKEDGSEKGVLGLLRGGFRTITGWIGRKNKDAYLVRTPTATIGIRGTDHEPLYIPTPAPGQTALGEPGTYNKVNSGQTVIQTAGGSIELGANQVGFAPARPDAIPVRLAHIPGFMRATPAVRPDNRPGGQGTPGGQRPQRDSQSGTANPPPPHSLPPGSSKVGSMDIAPPPIAPLPQPGTIDLHYVAANSVAAPHGFVVAGGDLSPGQFLGNGSGFVGNPLEGMAILLDGAGNPLSVGTNSGFNYDRAGAPLVDSGSTVVNGKTVRWGVYAGGVINDNQGLRYPQYFFFMGGGTATTLANLHSTLPVPGANLVFTNVGGHTKPITENGTIGGSVNSITVELKNLAGAITVYNYALSLSDGQGRIWAANLTAPQLLANFVTGGTGPNLNATCSGCAMTTGAGSASGMAFGNPAPAGVISSYSLKAGSSGVAGAVLAK